MSKLMCFIMFVIFYSLNLSAQDTNGSVVKMTAAEYQNLMETILKAKRKRMLAYRYRQAQASSNAISNIPATKKQIEVLEPNVKAIENNKEQLERDAAHQNELAKIKNDLERKIEALEKSQEKNAATNQNGSYDYPRASKSVDTERLEKHISRLEKELLDQRKNSASKKDFRKLEKELSSLEQDQIKNIKNDESKYLDKIEKLEQQQNALKKQFDLLLVVSNSDKVEGQAKDQTPAILELGKKITDLENEVNTLKKNNRYANLEKEVLELKSVQEKTIQTVPDNSEVLALKKEIDGLKAELKNHRHASSVIPVPNNPVVKEDVRTFITKHRQQNVFFPNGSPILTNVEKNKIDQVANWLDTYEELDIIVKGFASNTGSQEVNQQLSKSRAETVRNYLLSIGVKANRISLEPLGIDTTVSDPASARRAEIHFYLKQ